MIRVIGDEIFMNYEKVGEITIPESTLKDNFKEFLEEEIPTEIKMCVPMECPECEHNWNEEFTYDIEGDVII